MISSIFQILGGLALFMLAMEMMTNGLKNAAGSQLRHLLGHWTKTPLRGLAAGAIITGIVQHSGAVTVATIGFVNAGLLTLKHSLGVIFGSNIGTTMTGWLVSLVGFGFKIEAMALPLLAAGVGLRMISRVPRNQFLGEALAGFALFFLGLSILKTALEAAAGGFTGGGMISSDYGLPMFLLIGLVATILTQSSSASLAIVLTAAAGGLISLHDAAAAVIGANLGSTSTAALSAIKATANARRLAVGHILFNLVTGAIALLIMPLMLWTVAQVTDLLDLASNPAVSLAIFHTLFNVLGAAVMLPFTAPFARFLGRLFRSKEEDNAEPRYLDDTLITTPELAIGAVDQEMKRLIRHTRGLLRVCLDREGLNEAQIGPKADAIRSLNSAITDYIGRLNAEKMQISIVEALAISLRTCRYLSEATMLAPQLLAMRRLCDRTEFAGLASLHHQYLDILRELVVAEEPSPELVGRAEQAYQDLKAQTLQLMVRHTSAAGPGGEMLDALSGIRRMSDQWGKSLHWRSATDYLNKEHGHDHDHDRFSENPQ
ncbi:Na/Pi cotransporter family protein [Marinobacter persicus]|uniref:Phosphate:Na+ symporter n=1 Tax=Marinobacter persicus TaxID=930118 RepID=A0A2S6G8Q4_9GAMM|nr:Na/Pi cotransporter family protein [Marinobacter persicus]PPK52581.1 phosphate:Na+ symporter [Marinobacter persicus]PPK55554.1 phosphate:Na+ symporter [Marinobacter persicus]PPK58456.1 phosphate:Na+ symporter [Marinobacter persicus]